jgi:hypothetical protein
VFLNFALTAFHASDFYYENQDINGMSQANLVFDIVIMIFFTLELAVNIFCHFKVFWKSFANWFDVVIVAGCLMGYFVSAVGESSFTQAELSNILVIVNTLRVMRTFQLVKVFPQLRRIVQTLVVAIPSCSYVILLLLLVNIMYSILGISLYGQDHPKYFGHLTAGMYTLFQVMTCESWGQNIARPVMETNKYAAWYFCSFIMVSTFVLMVRPPYHARTFIRVCPPFHSHWRNVITFLFVFLTQNNFVAILLNTLGSLTVDEEGNIAQQRPKNFADDIRYGHACAHHSSRAPPTHPFPAHQTHDGAA